MIKRLQLVDIEKNIDHKKAIILLGARQVGKTSLIRELGNKAQQPFLYFNADEPIVRQTWRPENINALLTSFGNNKLILLDEAQQLENAGLTLKIILDKNLGYQFLVTGSSALELANKTYEPLTGRKWAYDLLPLSVGELVNHFGLLHVKQSLSNLLIYGCYPEVIMNRENPLPVLSNIMQSYLYKDIFALANVRKPAVLEKLLRALAWQMGNEVSLNELSRLCGADVKTLDNYIELLQKTYIIFSLPSFSRNLRNELGKAKKIYFYDNGIRNAIINNYAPPESRNDIGQLWENFLMSERLKFTNIHKIHCNRYFWRTTAQQEIDYIEETNGQVAAYEFKWNPEAKQKFSKSFVAAYKPASTQIINKENFWEWLTK